MRRHKPLAKIRIAVPGESQGSFNMGLGEAGHFATEQVSDSWPLL